MARWYFCCSSMGRRTQETRSAVCSCRLLYHTLRVSQSSLEKGSVITGYQSGMIRWHAFPYLPCRCPLGCITFLAPFYSWINWRVDGTCPRSHSESAEETVSKPRSSRSLYLALTLSNVTASPKIIVIAIEKPVTRPPHFPSQKE